jgi:ABC-2 type transport system permease protein
VFIVSDSAPRFVAFVGDVFPVKHLSAALYESFDPLASGVALPWANWGVIAAWGLLGSAVVATRFRWTPWGT